MLKPLNPPFVGMYVCGPTVYSEAHLGNVRSFVAFDVIYRWLMYLGYNVRYVRNITDVGHMLGDSGNGEDRMLKQARLLQLEPMEVAQRYTYDFHNVLQQFNCLPPNIEPLASGHIIEQIEAVKRIIEAGYAYEINGSVYFDVAKYNQEKGYGVLSGRKIEDLLSNTRTLDRQDEKRNPLDFALWKKAAPEHIMRWPSPWSEGFPGWHLECSVMSTKYLGTAFDIHGGGIDLKFPHHECEIAQNTGAFGKTGAKYWLHTNMLTVNGAKMSKSLKNGITPKELISGNHPLLDKGYGPMTVRFFMLQTHYSSTLDFSNQALQAAEKGYQRLMKAFENVNALRYEVQKVNAGADKEINDLLNEFEQHMNNDFNTAKALAVLFDISYIINAISNGQPPAGIISKKVFDWLCQRFTTYITDVFGLKPVARAANDQLEQVMALVIEMRNAARKKKDFETSDNIRDSLNKMGIKLLDGKSGTTWEIQ